MALKNRFSKPYRQTFVRKLNLLGVLLTSKGRLVSHREEISVTCTEKTTSEDVDRLLPRQIRTPDGASSPTLANLRRRLEKEYTSGATQNGQVSNQSSDEGEAVSCFDELIPPKLAMKLECVESDLKHCIASTPRRSNRGEVCGIAAEVTSMNPMSTPQVSPVLVRSHLNQLPLCSTDDNAYSNKATCSQGTLHPASGRNFSNVDPATPKHHRPLPTKIVFTKNDFHETYSSVSAGHTARYS